MSKKEDEDLPWYTQAMAHMPDYEAQIDKISVFGEETKARLKREILIQRTIAANTVAYLHKVRMGSYYGTLTISYCKIDACKAKVAWSFCKELQVLVGNGGVGGARDLAAVAMPLDKFDRRTGRRLAAMKFLDFSVVVPLDPQNSKTQTQIFQYFLYNGLSVDKDEFPRPISIEPIGDYFSRLFAEKASNRLSEGTFGSTPEAYGLIRLV